MYGSQSKTMGIFSKQRKTSIQLPDVLTKQDDPVNYNSVLDYLVGLSRPDYEKLAKVSAIYRNANKEAARILGIEDAATVTLREVKPSDAEIDGALDDALNDNGPEFIEDDISGLPAKPAKEQAPLNLKKTDA
jgi:hypothetical protein